MRSNTGISETSKKSASTKLSKTTARKSTAKKPVSKEELKTLAIDIGGTGLKASVLNAEGEMMTERVRVATPEDRKPAVIVEALAQLVAQLPAYDRVSVGFPGVVRRGKIITAHNLGTEDWKGFDLDLALTDKLGSPVRVLNDADIQGLGAIQGKGIEMTITLGTGLGSSMVEDGRLAPHLELAHHPFRKGETYEEQLGNEALKAVGKKRWSRRVQKAIGTLRVLANFDHLYIGGGNAGKILFELPADVSLVPNELGMRGGIWLWRERGHGSLDIFLKTE